MTIRDDLIRDEGIRLTPYKDTEGVLTIGIGRNLQEGITEAEAVTLLDNDIVKHEKDLDRAEPWWRGRPECIQRALLNMCFNMGISRLGGFKKMLAALHAGDYQTAHDEALNSQWAKQVGERAVRVASLFLEAKNGTST